MQVLNEYIRNIMYVVVLSAFVGIIIPDGVFRKYVEFVMGMLVIVAMVSPIAGLLGGAQGTQEWRRAMEGIQAAVVPMDNQAALAQLSTRMIHENANAIIAQQLEAMLEGTGYELVSSHALLDDEGIRELRVGLARLPYQGEDEVESAPQERTPFIRIQRVQVAPRQHTPSDQGPSPEIERMISDFYNMDIGNIHIELKG